MKLLQNPVILFQTLLLVAATPFLNAQSTIFQYLSDLEEPHLTLSMNIDSLLDTNERFTDATLGITSADGDHVEWEIKVRPRGRFRRKACDFPPLQFNFSKKDLRKAGYAEFDKIKLVLPCISGPDSIENIMEEKLVYDLYNIITEESFKTKIVRVTVLSESESNPIEYTGFIIEPNDELAHRMGGTDVEMFNPPRDSLDPANYNRVAVFQFMVGNFDWDTQLTRNVRYIRAGDYNRLFLVPYDFDYSSIVSASYMAADASFGISQKLDRVYLGKHFNDILAPTIDEILDHKDEILDYVSDYELLSKSRRGEISGFLKTFFRYVDKPGRTLQYKFILSN